MTEALSHKGCRIGIDVGGTFTDFVLSDPASNRIVRFKESSVPDDPSLSVERGLPQLLARAGIQPADVELIVHGTTLPLNAIIQRRGARLGLVVSRGNRGVLEIGRSQLSSAFSFLLEKEEPLVPRSRVLDISARLDAKGNVVADTNDEELEAVASRYRADNVAAVTVMLINSFANPEFEADVAERLAKFLPGIPVTSSSEIWPERREYERALVALMNAYVQPIMTDYLDKLIGRVRGLGLEAPVYITSNNGGTLSIRTARERPIDTILSGPASGVVAASVVSGQTPFKDVVTIDIGGTSADMSVIKGLDPSQTTRTTIGNLPIIVPVVAVSAIGAGGGSIVWVDSQGLLKVGPQSAGASPGPACYGRGGTQATLTDCYLIAGYVHEKHFLGGRLKLDRPASQRALEEIADKLGVTGDDRAAQVADAAIRITTAMMSSEVSREMAQHGEDAADYALVAFGGAGPTHANHLADDAGIKSVIVPTAPSTFCALGAILSDVKRDFVASKFIDLAEGDTALAGLSGIYRDLRQRARTWIEPDLELLGEVEYEAVADMRYRSQAFSLSVALPASQQDKPSADILRELFHEGHEKLYGYRDTESEVEITAQRLRIVSRRPPVKLPKLSGMGAGTVPDESRDVYFVGGFQTALVYQRDTLAPDQVIPGPAIVEQEDTTTVILPNWTATVDGLGNIIISRQS